MTNTGAIIVTWNSEVEIGPCLDSVLPRVDEVVVVDNASSDRTREEVLRRPAARLIANTTNRGFAAAVNQGAATLSTPFLLLLNPDTELLTGVEPLVEACSQPAVAAAGGKLIGANGCPQEGFMVRRLPTPLSLALETLGLNRILPRNPINRRYRCLDLSPHEPAEAEQPAGAFLMILHDVWEQLGGFDEGFYPVWFEEVDFLKRARNRGYQALYVPTTQARHGGGRSVGKLDPESRQVYWYASLLRYSAKHFRAGEFRVVCGTVLLGSALRMVAGVALELSLGPVRIYGRVIRLVCSRLFGRRAGGKGSAPVLAQR